MDVSKLLEKASQATERGNYDYAIDLYHQLLMVQPKALKARQLLREVEVRKYQEIGLGGGTKALAYAKGLPCLLKLAVHNVTKNYEKSMIDAESFLRGDPSNAFMLRALGNAAWNAEQIETAIWIFEDLREKEKHLEGSKAGISTLRSLGALYHQANRIRDALDCYEDICRVKPDDREAHKALRDLAALNTMKEGNWEDTSSYRDKIKDTDEAKKLEEEQQIIRTDDDVLRAIERVTADVEKEPNNKKFVIQLGDLNTRAKDFEGAMQAYRRAKKIDPADIVIDEKMGDVKMAEMSLGIEKLQEQLTANPADAELKQKVAATKKQLWDFRYEEYGKRVKAHPTDLGLRYEFGTMLMTQGKLKEASGELQVAVKDPRVKRLARHRLGICFFKQGMYDMAAAQFQQALEGVAVTSDQAKEVMYNLAITYEKLDDLDNATETFKKLFEIDINYKDVAQRIEEIYKRLREGG